MSKIYKTSNAYITPSPARLPFWILESKSPEIIFEEKLSAFFLEVGFADLYPNFGTVNIRSVHPFAKLLLQEVLGQNFNFNVFPSITIADSSDNEQFSTVGRDVVEIVLTDEIITELLGHADQGELIISDPNKARLKSLSQEQGLIGRKTDVKWTHSVDFNVWSENKTLTGLLYDFIQSFFTGQSAILHSQGVDVQGSLQGRRSGDINVEFGKLLYGANITVSMTVQVSAMYIDPQYTIITTIVQDPNYAVRS